MNLDVLTLLVVLVAECLLMAGMLWVACAGRFRDGMGKWSAGLALLAGAWLLFALRGRAPDFLTVVAANTLAVLSWSLMLGALLEFHRYAAPRWLYLVPSAAMFALMIALLDEFHARVVLVNGWFGLANLTLAYVFTRAEPHARRTLHWLVASSFALLGGMLLVRSLIAAFDAGAIAHYLQPSTLQTLTFMVICCTLLSASFGFLLMHMERSDAENRRLAEVDSLTGALNRRVFLDLADAQMERALRDNAPASLLVLDLDHFKRLNDTCGHLAGDRVLVAFANLVRETLRRNDLLVRYGGEEFCALLPGADAAAATAVAERIRVRFEKLKVPDVPVAVTVSIGAATAPPGSRTKLQDLLARADEALYAAKHRGRNHVVWLPLHSTAQSAA